MELRSEPGRILGESGLPFFDASFGFGGVDG